MIRALALALSLVTFTQSPSTLAAVAVFTANVERKWPADDREPFVTAEALRLMGAAARAVAEERKADAGKVRDAMTAFETARTAAGDPARSEDMRAMAVRDALIKGEAMMTALAAGLRDEDATTKQRLAELKRTAEALDRKRQVRQQGESLERYFHAAVQLLQTFQARHETTS